MHPWLTLRAMATVATLDPGVPLNAGLQRPIRLTAPAGTLVNPRRPAAVGVRHAACVRVNDLLNGALGQAAPAVMTAANSGMIVPVVVAEPDAQGGRVVQVVEPMTGGTGARLGHDGTDGRDPSISNLANNPVETVEAELDIEIERYALRAGSAGAGEWRGGCGLELAFRIGRDDTLVLARGMERALFRPWGMAGGGPGAPAHLLVERAAATPQTLSRIDVLTLARGDRVTLLTAGAGGYGDPFRRDPARVRDDVRRGLLDAAAARRDYGVALADGAVDEAATHAARAGRRDPVDAAGPERSAWDSVFAPDLLDRLASALAPLPVARRQAIRTALYAKVLAALPQGFPATSADAATCAGARAILESGIAASGDG